MAPKHAWGYKYKKSIVRLLAMVYTYQKSRGEDAMKKNKIHFQIAKFMSVAALVLLTGCGKEESMQITGGQEYMYAPHAGETTQSAPFVVMKGEGGEAQPVEVTWSVLSSGAGVSIDGEGVVTLTDAYVAGDINGTDITLQAAWGDDAREALTTTLHVREAQRVASFDISLPDAVKRRSQPEIALANCLDQYGEPMEAPDPEDILWETSDENLTVSNGALQCYLAGTEIDYAAVCATVDGVSVEKKFIVHSLEEYQPDAAALEQLAQARVKVLREIDFSQGREVDAGAYAYVNQNAAGLQELAVDVTGLVNYSPNTVYQVTVRHEDGSVTKEDMHADGSGKINLKLDRAAAVEVSPVLMFSLGQCEFAETDGYIHVEAKEKYTGEELYGFYGSVGGTTGGVNLRNESGMFVAALPDGFYSIRITKPKSGTGRSTVRINGASQGTNVGNKGTGDRNGALPYIYLMEDVRVDGGTMRLSLSEKDYSLAAVEIRKTPEITERRVHIYIGGDSTVSNYYPIETSEPQPGRYQTGWGQVFAQYVTEENAVTNLAGGGTYARSWYEMAFPGVVQNGQPGDYFIIQAGINDRSYSNVDEMVQYLTKMIDECREKGIIVILATTMQSCKFWKDAGGNELGEFGTPEGSGLAPFMDAIRKLAEDKKVFLVDTGKMTGEWYSVVGRTYVAQNYHLYNSHRGIEEDTLHLSYHGALKVAELVATSLAQQKAADATDGQGNTLDGLSMNDMVTYDVVHKDSTGKEVTTSVTGVQAIYKRYAE